MRRTVIVLVTVVLTLVGGAPTLAGASPPWLDRAVSGPVSGSQRFDYGHPRCAEVHQQFDGTYATAGGLGTVHLEGCAEGIDPVYRYVGSFVITTPSGATLRGTATGTISDPELTGAVALAFDLTVTSGTRRYHRVGGTIDFTGEWPYASGDAFTGVLTASLTRLPSR